MNEGDIIIKKEKQKIQLKKYILPALLILFGIVGWFFVGMHFAPVISEGKTITEKLLWFLLLFAGIFMTMFLQLFIHELGHLVFGVLTGYQFSSLRIGSCMLLKENGRLRIKWLSIAGTGGQCLLIPPEPFNEKSPFILYNLGGSIFNIVSSLGFFVIYLRFENVVYVSTFLLILSAVGFMLALINGIPMKLGLVNNDGHNTLACVKDRKTLLAFFIQLSIVEKISRGTRLKDMPEEWFSILPLEEMENSILATLGVFACNRLLDSHQFNVADHLMEQVLGVDSLAGVYRNLLTCDRIYCEIIGENRKDILDIMLDNPQKGFMKSMKRFPSVLRTEYAYQLMVENDLKKAEKIMLEFEKVARTYPYKCDIESERELINIVKQVSENS